MSLLIGIFAIVTVVSVYLMRKRVEESLHMVQLEGYKAEEYMKWLSNNKVRAYSLKKPDIPIKKPLVMTLRASRLYKTNFLVSVLLVLLPTILFLTITSNILILTFLLLYKQLHI